MHDVNVGRVLPKLHEDAISPPCIVVDVEEQVIDNLDAPRRTGRTDVVLAENIEDGRYVPDNIRLKPDVLDGRPRRVAVGVGRCQDDGKTWLRGCPVVLEEIILDKDTPGALSSNRFLTDHFERRQSSRFDRWFRRNVTSDGTRL